MNIFPSEARTNTASGALKFWALVAHWAIKVWVPCVCCRDPLPATLHVAGYTRNAPLTAEVLLLIVQVCVC
jgi:hypothetical protein